MAVPLNKPFVVGITGRSGAGKTFFLKSFLRHFRGNEICLISQDDYYIPVDENMTAEENKLYNFDLPEAIDMDWFVKDLQKLIGQETIYKTAYTFNNPNLSPQILVIKAAPIILVEGLFILHSQQILEQLDFTIFIDADDDIALARRIRRDFTERGYSAEEVMYKWLHHVNPAYQAFLQPYKHLIDKIIYNNTASEKDIIVETELIAHLLRKTLTTHKQ